MQPDLIFDLANLAPLPIWLAWILAPRSTVSRYLAGTLWPWVVLGILYVLTLGTGLVRGGEQGANMASLAGVMLAFDQPWIALGGWVHYLCFDLFVARWMMNDAPDAGHRLSPVLALTLFAGPAGLLAYVGLRDRLRAA